VELVDEGVVDGDAASENVVRGATLIEAVFVGLRIRGPVVAELPTATVRAPDKLGIASFCARLWGYLFEIRMAEERLNVGEG